MFGSSLRVRRASDERRRVPASITFVSVEKETSARGRLVGPARAVPRRSRLRVLVYLFWLLLLVVVLWCVGNPDLWDRGLVCFWGTFLCGLFTPTNPSPGHRFVPESQNVICFPGGWLPSLLVLLVCLFVLCFACWFCSLLAFCCQPERLVPLG